jgi:hypothetical protein
VERIVRRELIRSLAFLVLFGGAVWAGFHLASRLAPERLRIETERRLSRLLETPVQVERARLSLGWGLALEAHGVDLKPAGTEGRLHIDRVAAHMDPVALLMARVWFERLVLERASLNIEAALPGAEPDGGGPDLRHAIETLDQAARSWLERSLPVRTMELRNGVILITNPALEDPSGIRIEAVGGLARRASFRNRTELRIRGRIRNAEGNAGWLHLRAEVDRSVRVALLLEPMDLAILAPYASHLGFASELGGLTEGTLSWRYQPGRPQSLAIRLEGGGLHASLPRGAGKSPFRVAPERLTVTSRIEFSANSLRLREAAISDGQVTLRSEGSLALPVTRDADLRLSLQLEELPLPSIGRVLAYLPPEIRERLDPWSQRLEAGQLLALRAEAHTTLAGLRELVETRMPDRPGELTVRAKIADAWLRVGDDDRRLEGLSGSAIWSGDSLELREVRGRLGARSLPRLDATVRGLAEIRSLDEVQCIPPPAEVSLPGFGKLRSWLGSHRRPSREPSWTQLTVDADWIHHPALLCTVEHAFGEMFPAPDGLDFAVKHGVWAGVPIRGAASYRRAPEQSLRLEMSLGPPFESMQLEPEADPWAKGHWEFQANRLGRWRIRGASGSFRISGSTLRLEKSTLLMAPDGELEGNLEVPLDKSEELPFRFEAQIQKMELVDLRASAGLEEDFLSGRLVGAGVISGRLHEGRPLLSDAEGVLTLHAREGRIHRKLPLFVAIAVASDRFDPFRAGEKLPYTAIDFTGRLEDGQLHSEFLSLDSTSLGVVASGRVGALAPYEVEAVVGLFFFPTLDSLINRVPVLNRVILGHDENLVGAYFAMTGPWKEQKAQLIPVKSFAEAPAHFMLEGPSFVWSGLRRLESLLNPSSGVPAAQEEGGPDS